MAFCSVFEHQKKKYLFGTVRTRCKPVIEGRERLCPILLLAGKGDYASRQSSITAKKVEFPLASSAPLSAYDPSLSSLPLSHRHLRIFNDLVAQSF